MKIVIQSEAPTKLSYIHLAYISVQLENRISRGELYPFQTMLGIAAATAIACAAIGSKFSAKGTRAHAVKIWVMGGFFGTLALLWLFQLAWSESRSNEQALDHVIKTSQFWALRDPQLGSSIEAAAQTNGKAAGLAASYYGLKRHTSPEDTVKSYRYAELAATASARRFYWAHPFDFTNSWPSPEDLNAFQGALKNGKLSAEEKAWTQRQLARMEEAEPETKP
jgi:hypothetical protein